MDRYVYLNQDHFITKLNNCFLISVRTFSPQKLITITIKNVTADVSCCLWVPDSFKHMPR